MKISIITGPFMCLPPDSIGAVEKLWSAVGEYWTENGEDVQFVCKKPSNNEYARNRTYIKGYERTGSWKKDFGLDFIYSFKALCAVKDTDILVLNSQWSPILIRLFRKKYKKSIYSVERFPKRQLGYYKKVGNVDDFRCCSTAVYNEAIKQNPELEKCAWVVPNFINTKVFCGNEREIKNNPTVVYAGRINREKGLDILVKAIESINKYPDIRVNLSLIGSYNKEDGGSGEEYKKQLDAMAKNYKIKWISAIYDPKELADKIQMCDIFCYPSIAEKGESFGVAPLEAMGLGLPVVLSNLSCFQDYLKVGQNGLKFDHKAYNASDLLAEEFITLIKDPVLYKNISKGALETAKLYSVERVAKQYLAKFEEILDG